MSVVFDPDSAWGRSAERREQQINDQWYLHGGAPASSSDHKQTGCFSKQADDTGSRFTASHNKDRLQKLWFTHYTCFPCFPKQSWSKKKNRTVSGSFRRSAASCYLEVFGWLMKWSLRFLKSQFPLDSESFMGSNFLHALPGNRRKTTFVISSERLLGSQPRSANRGQCVAVVFCSSPSSWLLFFSYWWRLHCPSFASSLFHVFVTPSPLSLTEKLHQDVVFCGSYSLKV